MNSIKDSDDGDNITGYAGRDEKGPYTICSDEQESDLGLWGAKPGCDGKVRDQIGGGVKCEKCGGWLCL